MQLELDKAYVDGEGVVWRVISVDGPVIAPVTAGRWYGKTYRTRTYQRNGWYWRDYQCSSDLIREACDVDRSRI